MARTDFHKTIIGRAEALHFVDLAIADVPAKVDTGAYRSAVHADKIRLSDDGKTLHFRLLGGHPLCGALATELSTTTFKTVFIENSFGHREQRYEVKLRVKLGPKVFSATFSLADRGKKVYPILLGRKMLNNRFLVDTAHAQINRKELKQQYGIEFPADEEEGR
ncbi:MAG TPA: RimK/LysX family protein [Candidatus Saccharimonadales bacterium]|nr:RimK/LysX family protein [Candidatus Saccharimonadales bacterium]